MFSLSHAASVAVPPQKYCWSSEVIFTSHVLLLVVIFRNIIYSCWTDCCWRAADCSSEVIFTAAADLNRYNLQLLIFRKYIHSCWTVDLHRSHLQMLLVIFRSNICSCWTAAGPQAGWWRLSAAY